MMTLALRNDVRVCTTHVHAAEFIIDQLYWCSICRILAYIIRDLVYLLYTMA